MKVRSFLAKNLGWSLTLTCLLGVLSYASCPTASADLGKGKSKPFIKGQSSVDRAPVGGGGDVTDPIILDVDGPDGTYARTQTIDITVTFDEAVTVDTGGGTPTLELETGSSDCSAAYQSGTGTENIVFRCTVANAHLASDLDYKATTSLVTNGGTMRDAAGNDADLTLASPGAAGSLANGAAIIVEGCNVFTCIDQTEVTWNACYTGENLVGATWSDSSGAGLDLTAANDNATVDKSTTGLTALGGIGYVRTNKAVANSGGAASNDDYTRASFVWGSGASDFHIRFITKLNEDITTTQFFFRHLTSATQWVRIVGSTAPNWTFNPRHDADGGSYSRTLTTMPANGVWALTDFSFCASCGASSFSQMTIFSNGTNKTPTEHTVAITPDGTGTLSIMGAGGASGINADFVGWCVRFGARLTSEAAHDADLARIGL